jgi:hypothetical protein
MTIGLVTLFVYLIVAALVWWLLTGYLLPLLPEPARTVVLVVVVLIAILFLLSIVGIGPGVNLR